MKNYDIVIIGGGFVGASALLALESLSSPLKIALIDAASPQRSTQDARSIVLSYGSQRILTRWGCWQPLHRDSLPLLAVHISQAGVLGRVKITAQHQGVPALGYVVPADRLGAFLNTQIMQYAYFHHTQCTHLAREGEKMCLDVQSPTGTERWKARLVLAADGAHSKIRTLMGLPVETHAYDAQVLLTQVQVKYPNQTAYERFIGEEALAMVPRGGNQYGVIWKATPQRIQEYIHLSPPDFLKKLTAQLGYRLGPLSELGLRTVYPLQRIRALQETLPGLVLLGDAAHTNVPMAAQGLNLSLRDIALLVDKIKICIQNNQDFSQAAFLKAYEDQRLADQARMISLIHLPFTRLFRTVPDALKGLVWLEMDLCGSVKGRFARTMMGLVNN